MSKSSVEYEFKPNLVKLTDVILYIQERYACLRYGAVGYFVPPEPSFGRLGSDWFIIRDNITKYVCPTVIIDIARKNHQIYQFLKF